MDAAEQRVRDTAQYFPFTREISKRLSMEQRVGIVEMLWEVAYADGVLDPHEDMLLRQIAGLIHVPDRERGMERASARSKRAAALYDRRQGRLIQDIPCDLGRARLSPRPGP